MISMVMSQLHACIHLLGSLETWNNYGIIILLKWQTPCMQTDVTAMRRYPEWFDIWNETKSYEYIGNYVEVFLAERFY